MVTGCHRLFDPQLLDGSRIGPHDHHLGAARRGAVDLLDDREPCAGCRFRLLLQVTPPGGLVGGVEPAVEGAASLSEGPGGPYPRDAENRYAREPDQKLHNA